MLTPVKVLLTAGVLALLTCGCAERPASGTIIAKRHLPAHTQSTVVPVTGGRSASSVPVTYEVPETYELTIQTVGGGRTRTVNVTAGEYDRVRVGDPYPPP